LRDFRKTGYIRKTKKENIFKERIKKRTDLLKELEKLKKQFPGLFDR